MFQGTRTRQIRATGSSRNPREGEWVWKALAALAIGALLGALAALPYDRLLGMPGATGAILRLLVATVVLAGLNAGRAQHMVFDEVGIPQVSSQKSAACKNVPSRWRDLDRALQIACRSLRWNLDRHESVLKVQAEAMVAPHGG